MKSTDLLLIHPAGQKKIYQGLSFQWSAVEPPIWAVMTAGFIQRRGFSVKILDAEVLGLDAVQTARKAQEMAPRLIAIAVYGHNPSASTQFMPAVRDVCCSLKAIVPDIPIILFGGHAAALPERTLQEEPVHFVSDGEGPETVLQLLRERPAHDPSKIPDLWYRDRDQIRRSAFSADLLLDLDEAFSDFPWDLLPMDQYRAHNWHCFGGHPRSPYVSLYTTLGCPYHCSFCCIQAPFKNGEKNSGLASDVNSYRRWKPETILRQIDFLVKNYGIKNIKIADEMFVLNAGHVEALCEGLIQRNYGLNLWAYARVDTVKDALLPKLKRAGFNWLAFGIEAADAKVRDQVHKGFEQALIREVMEKVQKSGIHVIGNYIFGLPEDDLRTMQATLELASELNTEFANFYCAMPYPGSELFRKTTDTDDLPKGWSGYSQHSVDTFPLATRHLSSGQILRFRDEAFERYFSNPRYLRKIEQKFGRETRNQIDQMLSYKMVRAYE